MMISRGLGGKGGKRSMMTARGGAGSGGKCLRKTRLMSTECMEEEFTV